MDEKKMKALEAALTGIERQFGKGSIMRMGEARARMQVETVPSGILSLDLALGVGGIPRGRIVEIYGPESGGKTTVALHIIAEVQKLGGIAAFIDAEHALDPSYAARLGVNIDDMLISQPDTGEQALEICEALVRSGAVDVVVIDSVAALVPRQEIEGEMGAVGKSNCICIFINQIREKVGVVYGNPETTSGGRALKFYSSIRLEVRKGEALKQGSEIVGNKTKIKVVKNKVAPPFKVAEFDIMYGQGVSREGGILDMAVELDIVKRSGTWYSYQENRIGQGRENAKAFLKENPEVAKEIEDQVRLHFSDSPHPAAPAEDEAAE